ncbi:hypothetical protein [Actinobaculum sp. 352]|uniref:hypothetical protein n=1 Tax=Actinobaculum sp. 352 TaxID=2490946 RepID=UPI000F7E7CDA|nr:hypothetical protein [Actinobaculum sp. 352]RTE49343.1 hypothetical protein EKN07_07185 [Actinobaculum sp. 352]
MITPEDLARRMLARRGDRLARVGEYTTDTWPLTSPVLRRIHTRDAEVVLGVLANMPKATPDEIGHAAFQALKKHRSTPLIGLSLDAVYAVYHDVMDMLAVLWGLPATVNPLEGDHHE